MGSQWLQLGKGMQHRPRRFRSAIILYAFDLGKQDQSV